MLESIKLEKINEDTLNDLKESGEMENIRLDYKKELKTKTNSDKKEFLTDIVSFANTSGGDIIYGIKEDNNKKGFPEEICGLCIDDKDKKSQDINNIILNNKIQPRLYGYKIHFVKLSSGKYVIIIRIPKSWNAPHCVVPEIDYSSIRFPARNSSGKYYLDIQSIKSEILKSETIIKKIKDFRINRINDIESDETPIPLTGTSKIILHLIPINAFELGSSFNTQFTYKVNKEKKENLFYKLETFSGCEGHYITFDGWITFSKNKDYNPDNTSYTLYFRNGIIEAVDIDNFLVVKNYYKEDVIPIQKYEKRILNLLLNFLYIQKELSINPPFIIMISLLNVKNHDFKLSKEDSPSNVTHLHVINKQHLLLPEIILDDYNKELGSFMKPLFEMIWNAAGYDESVSYKNGKFKARDIYLKDYIQSKKRL